MSLTVASCPDYRFIYMPSKEYQAYTLRAEPSKDTQLPLLEAHEEGEILANGMPVTNAGVRPLSPAEQDKLKQLHECNAKFRSIMDDLNRQQDPLLLQLKAALTRKDQAAVKQLSKQLSTLHHHYREQLQGEVMPASCQPVQSILLNAWQAREESYAASARGDDQQARVWEQKDQQYQAELLQQMKQLLQQVREGGEQ